MQRVTVTVTVDESGGTEVDVNGTKGKGCEKYTDAVIRALGGEVTSEVRKPEYATVDANKIALKN